MLCDSLLKDHFSVQQSEKPEKWNLILGIMIASNNL